MNELKTPLEAVESEHRPMSIVDRDGDLVCENLIPEHAAEIVRWSKLFERLVAFVKDVSTGDATRIEDKADALLRDCESEEAI